MKDKILIAVTEEQLNMLISKIFEEIDIRERLCMEAKDKRRSVNSILTELTSNTITITYPCSNYNGEIECTIKELNEDLGIDIYGFI